MKMDVYSVIREAKEGNILDSDEVERIYSLANDGILFKIVAKEDNEKEEKSDVVKFAETILKNRDDFWEAKRNEKLDDFEKNINSKLKSIIKKNRKEVKKELFDQMNSLVGDLNNDGKVDVSDSSPNVIFFRLFLTEYNTKYAFTWKAFKETKRLYEKSHPVDGEDIYVLKSLLEKDPKIDKVVDSTVFSKAVKTLTDSTINKIKEKIG